MKVVLEARISLLQRIRPLYFHHCQPFKVPFNLLANIYFALTLRTSKQPRLQCYTLSTHGKSLYI